MVLDSGEGSKLLAGSAASWQLETQGLAGDAIPVRKDEFDPLTDKSGSYWRVSSTTRTEPFTLSVGLHSLGHSPATPAQLPWPKGSLIILL